jgi:hypothetical protein
VLCDSEPKYRKPCVACILRVQQALDAWGASYADRLFHTPDGKGSRAARASCAMAISLPRVTQTMYLSAWGARYHRRSAFVRSRKGEGGRSKPAPLCTKCNAPCGAAMCQDCLARQPFRAVPCRRRRRPESMLLRRLYMSPTVPKQVSFAVRGRGGHVV